jgi:hypothetical protein
MLSDDGNSGSEIVYAIVIVTAAEFNVYVAGGDEYVGWTQTPDALGVNVLVHRNKVISGRDRSRGQQLPAIIAQLFGELAILQPPAQEVGANRYVIRDWKSNGPNE